jgi:calcineurin-like phosphoesterase
LGDKAVVKINPEKPGKGNFVVRVDGKELAVVELLGMNRPFSSLKALDMEKVCGDVLKAIEA